MLVIIANLNATLSITESQVRDIQKKNPNIKQIRLINRVIDFEELIRSTDSPTVLISNFPPNSSYPDSETPIQRKIQGDYVSESYIADSYIKSSLLFEEVNAQPLVKAVHIITGAPLDMVNLKTLQQVLPDKTITFQNKSEWMDETKNYYVLYLRYLENILLKL